MACIVSSSGQNQLSAFSYQLSAISVSFHLPFINLVTMFEQTRDFPIVTTVVKKHKPIEAPLKKATLNKI
jgi:hypothetical protein